MKKILQFIIIALIAAVTANAQWKELGDTLVVQTLSYDSITTRSGTWQFPPKGSYEKILMHYSLKCDPRTQRDGFDCGEWDYLTYTEVTDSSGIFDSTALSSPNYMVRGNTPAKYYYTTTPYNYKEQATVFHTSFGDDLVDRTEVPINMDDSGLMTINPLNSKSFQLSFYYSKDEIDNISSNIELMNAIKLKFLDKAKINNFRIKIIKTNDSTIGGYSNSGQDYYDDDISVEAGEEKEFVLFNEFNFEKGYGLKIIISGEIEEGKLTLKAADNIEKYKSSVNLGAKNYIKFQKGSYIDVPKEAFKNIDKAITIGFWQFGDKVNMPENSYAFEGVNSKGQRVVNSHLPWSNGQVYWDAGNSGNNYDRISKQAEDKDFEGQWNYWTFTKDVNTGIMKIYLNGVEWLSGDTKTNGFDAIETFKIASNALGTGQYDGSMDNFAVWNRVLTEEEINTAMRIDFMSNKQSPIWNGLQLCYDMNQINNTNVPDITGNGNDGTMHGFAEVRDIGTKDLLIAEKTDEMIRPAVTFEKANFSGASQLKKTREDVYRNYPMPQDEVFIYDYDSPNKIIPIDEISDFTKTIKVPTKILKVYPANIQVYVYDEFGFKIDSVSAVATDSLESNSIKYYSPIVDYEIHRFITPYGINLDLGPDGFTWIEDVSDFAPLLHDYVKLSAGNQQELIDIKFYFVKGTPARDVKSVQTIWSSGGSYESIVKNNNIAITEITPNKDASMFKAKTRSSGHGFGGPSNTDNCSEFCKRTHRLIVGDNGLFEWEGWKECGDNPVYPQGGTWQIDRSDWCPGATVNTHNHELTGFVTPGKSVLMDYNIDNPSGFVPYGNYVFTGYLIGYGNPNFKNDAAIERIVTPTKEQEFGRFNPSCDGPEILVKNNGSEELTSLTFDYGIVGGVKSSYTWKGNMKFLENQLIKLPPLDFSDINEGAEYTFEVTLKNPNSKEDEYPKNNYATSKMEGVDILSSNFKLNIKTNNQAEQQYQMTLKKADGTIIKKMNLGDFESNKNYNLEFNLELGCYDLLFENTQGYGLDLWYVRDQLGTGYINLTSGKRNLTFNPDFGNFIDYQFSVGLQPQIKVSDNLVNFGFIKVGEKVEKSIYIEPENERGLTLKEIDMGFSGVKGMKLVKPENLTQDVFIPKGEKYEIVFSFEPKDDQPKNSIVTIRTNAENNSAYKVTLVGNTEISSVEDNFDYYYDAVITSTGNEKYLTLDNRTNKSENMKIDLYNMDGKFINNIFEGVLGQNKTNLPLNVTILESGVYLIKIDGKNVSKVLKFINIK